MCKLSYQQLRDNWQTEQWEANFRFEHQDYSRSKEAVKNANEWFDKMFMYPGENVLIEKR